MVCLPFSPTRGAADRQASPGSLPALSHLGARRGPAWRGGVGGGYLVGDLWGEKRKWDGMAFPAAREAPWAFVFRLELPALRSLPGGCVSSHVRACVIVTPGLAALSSPVPCLRLGWPREICFVFGRISSCRLATSLHSTDLLNCWLERLLKGKCAFHSLSDIPGRSPGLPVDPSWVLRERRKEVFCTHGFGEILNRLWKSLLVF